MIVASYIPSYICVMFLWQIQNHPLTCTWWNIYSTLFYVTITFLSSTSTRALHFSQVSIQFLFQLHPPHFSTSTRIFLTASIKFSFFTTAVFSTSITLLCAQLTCKNCTHDIAMCAKILEGNVLLFLWIYGNYKHLNIKYFWY